MARVKRGNVARKRRKKQLKLAKGFKGGISKLYRPAQQALLHAGIYAYKDRRLKKRDFRKIWILRINASLEEKQMNYSQFMGNCKKASMGINRKVLAHLAVHEEAIFNDIVDHVNK